MPDMRTNAIAAAAMKSFGALCDATQSIIAQFELGERGEAVQEQIGQLRQEMGHLYSYAKRVPSSAPVSADEVDPAFANRGDEATRVASTIGAELESLAKDLNPVTLKKFSPLATSGHEKTLILQACSEIPLTFALDSLARSFPHVVATTWFVLTSLKSENFAMSWRNDKETIRDGAVSH